MLLKHREREAGLTPASFSLEGEQLKLRKPCEHDRYDEHSTYLETVGAALSHYHNCPGGEFLPEDALVIPEPIVRPLGTPLTYAGVREVWDAFVKPIQEAEIPPSIEMRCLMATLRAVGQGYVDAGKGPAADQVGEPG